MNSLSQRTIFGGTAILVAMACASALQSPSVAVALVATILAAGLGCVAFAAQSRRLRDENHLVYRPVYARRQAVQRRIRSDD